MKDKYKKENGFKAAFKEIINGDLSENDDKKNDADILDYEQNSSAGNAINQVAGEQESYTAIPNGEKSNLESVIAEDMTIEGNITSSSKIRISGTVKGNVTSKNDIFISGKVQGDITGDNVSLTNSSVQGNIKASNKVSLIEKSNLDGDVKSVDLICHGKIQGNITADNLVEIASSGSVTGDISSKSIKIDENASIRGVLDICANKDK